MTLRQFRYIISRKKIGFAVSVSVHHVSEYDYRITRTLNRIKTKYQQYCSIV